MLCFVISNLAGLLLRKKCKFCQRRLIQALVLTFLRRKRVAKGGTEYRPGENTKPMAGRSCSFTPSPQPFNLPPLSLPVTLSGLHGRTARPPNPSSPTRSQRSPGHARDNGLREVGSSPVPPQIHPRAFQLSRDSLYKPFLHPPIGSVRSHQPSPAPRNEAWAPPTRLRPFQPRHQPPLPVPRRQPSQGALDTASLLPTPPLGITRPPKPACITYRQLQDVSGSYRILTPLPHPPSSRLLQVPPTSGLSQSETSNGHARVGAGGWVRACVYAMGGVAQREPRIGWGDVRGRWLLVAGSNVRIASEVRSRLLRNGGGRSRVLFGPWPGGAWQ